MYNQHTDILIVDLRKDLSRLEKITENNTLRIDKLATLLEKFFNNNG